MKSRHLKIIGTALALSLTASGCVNTNPGTPINIQTMSGSWYGEENLGAEKTIWLTQRTESGSFTTRFKKCLDNKKVFFQKKSGKWIMDGNLYTTITTSFSDGRQEWRPATPNRQFVESYTVHKLMEKNLRYSDHEHTFMAFKVSDNYKLVCHN